jgi:tetratricopeptide (TPR) repeat protein
LSLQASDDSSLYFARNYASGIEQLKEALALNPNFVPAQHALEAAYFQNDMYREAIGVRQDVFRRSGNADLAAEIGKDYDKSGYRGARLSWLSGKWRGGVPQLV